MSVDVLVVLDFFDADQTRRNSFAEVILREDWRHHPSVANAYYKSVPHPGTDAELTAHCERCMSDAANQVGLDLWDATCIIGDSGWLAGDHDLDNISHHWDKSEFEGTASAELS